MIALLICSLCVVAAQDRVTVPPSVQPLSDEMIDFINKLNTTWKAGRNFDKSVALSYVKGLMGVHRGNKTHKLEILKHTNIPKDLPESFDARQRWPKCNSIHVIRDQSSCGACWAFGAVEAISDRICIHTKGSVQVNISAQDLLTCCRYCSSGCKGGVPMIAWYFYKDKGIVTGGLYDVARATGRNTSRTNTMARESTHFTATRPSSGLKYSRTDPVEADFTVYDDFLSYKSGVYQAHSTKALGGHAIRLLGWGTENGVPYWLAANSWSERWGDKGYFKIRRGNNECGIENDINAGIPKEPKA
ncbi:hypothetical protein MTO96_003887 [Rhipicephalus appendiculatus]